MDLHLYFDARMGTLSVSLPFCLVPELWSNSSDLTEAMEVKSRRINVQLKCFLVNMVASLSTD